MIILLSICFYLVLASWICRITDEDRFGKMSEGTVMEPVRGASRMKVI